MIRRSAPVRFLTCAALVFAATGEALAEPMVPAADSGIVRFVNFFDDWAERYPDPYVSHLVRADYFLNRAVALRGHRWSRATTRERVDAMWQVLDVAD